ncbi:MULTISPECIES: hypothetical protein [Nocardioides]|uniref:hypothetical protein n=1 Tax=Nocardioides TaxID=1839 RepID=UPI00032E1183|nr:MULTISPECIES: hypothetical protein [Nocardioides]EON22521.1 hypothetical protein CF8_3706 [Nocardioides sp. CF8]
MIEPLQTSLLVASLLLAVVAGVYVALDRGPDNAVVALAGLLELGVIAQAVIGIAQVAGDDDVASPVTFVGYLLAAVLVLPLGVLWSLAERSRGATAVLIVAAVTVAFLVLRVVQLHG